MNGLFLLPLAKNNLASQIDLPSLRERPREEREDGSIDRVLMGEIGGGAGVV